MQFTFGIPDEKTINRLKAADIVLIGSVTTGSVTTGEGVEAVEAASCGTRK
ncbi:hypothetical protein O5Y46_02870 [Staphylococcus pseudintermedius]|nr:hypothetical protein [Staphylococcus pseudintermedius]MDF0289027.1 hypothetical protein [Staphylococcus pseudintermedius]